VRLALSAPVSWVSGAGPRLLPTFLTHDLLEVFWGWPLCSRRSALLLAEPFLVWLTGLFMCVAYVVSRLLCLATLSGSRPPWPVGGHYRTLFCYVGCDYLASVGLYALGCPPCVRALFFFCAR